MDAASGDSGHSSPLVMIRQGHAMHNPEDRRSMIELSRQTLWEPNQQRLYRVPGSVEQLNPATAPSQSTFSPSLQPPVYQAHAGNRHSYSGGPVLLPQYGLITEDQLGKSQFGGFTSPPFQQRRLVSSQRSFDSSSTGGINQCGRRGRDNTRSLVLSAVSEDDMSSSAHRRYGEVVDQGPDMTDSISSSPREGSGGGGSTPQLTPKHSARGSGGGGQHPQQQMYPVPGQLLVDPATGQHFIVPSQGGAAPAPQPIYYHPMYYPPPHGAPVQPAPAPHQFYGYAPVQGYPMAPLPQFSSRFAVPAYSPSMGGRAQYQQAACSTDEMTRVGDDSSSSPKAPGSPHFSKGVTSFAAGYHQSRRGDETDGRPSPPSSQPEDPEGPRDPFRRDVTRSSAEYRQMMSAMDLNATSSARFGGGPQTMMVAPGSAPVLPQTDQSAPVWWASPSSRQQRAGKGSFSGESTSYTDTESSSYVRRVTPPTLSSTTVSDTESSSRPSPSNPYFQQSPAPPAATTFAAQAAMNGQDSSPPMPKPKAIRMEIDLNKPMPEEEELRRAEEERNKAKASRAPPTAFTVSFGDEGGEGEERGGPGKGRGMTLQDAARRGRMARRSVGGGTPSAPTRGGSASAATSARPSTTSSPLVRQSSGGDDKGFLLERLLHGDKGRPATADPSPSSASSSGVHSMGRNSQRDTDNNSDAGTYVIGQSESRQHSTMITSQIIERDSDASSSDTETTVSRSPSPVGRKPRPLAPAASHPAAAPSPTAVSNEQTSRMLLTELAKLKAMGGAALTSPRGASSTAGSTASGSNPKARQTLISSLPNRSVFGMAASSAGLTAPRPSALPPPSPSLAATAASDRHHQPPMHSPQPVSSAAAGGGNFRKSKYRCQSETRADGGRFSMRSTSGVNGGGPMAGSAGGSPQTAPKRPPFKVGGGRPLLQSGNVAAEKQRENEMTAWLRRKDYNPMKAAMEAKKAAAAKNSSNSDMSEASTDVPRQDQFTNNRSISFHVGNNGQQKPPPRGAELVRNKSSESLHATAEDEARSHASQRTYRKYSREYPRPPGGMQVIAEYSRGVVEDINKLTRQHSKTKDQKALSGLAKVVDQLSTKCKKSIELIRAQNKGCLSVSVEDLLATAVEPPRDDEGLTDQLDRLSNAFDAVQRYLEQYSLDDKDLSSSESEEAQSGFSASGRRGGPPSTFSSFSAYRQPRGGQQTAGGNRSTFTSINARPGRATNAYRAKLMGGHRSPSGGRPSKNN